jgi:hypothetical protein
MKLELQTRLNPNLLAVGWGATDLPRRCSSPLLHAAVPPLRSLLRAFSGGAWPSATLELVGGAAPSAPPTTGETPRSGRASLGRGRRSRTGAER